MNSNEFHELPAEVDAAIADFDRHIERRNRFTVGELYDRLLDERLTDRDLLAITDIAKDLLYACVCHERVDIEKCRSMMGPVADAVWDEIPGNPRDPWPPRTSTTNAG